MKSSVWNEEACSPSNDIGQPRYAVKRTKTILINDRKSPLPMSRSARQHSANQFPHRAQALSRSLSSEPRCITCEDDQPPPSGPREPEDRRPPPAPPFRKRPPPSSQPVRRAPPRYCTRFDTCDNRRRVPRADRLQLLIGAVRTRRRSPTSLAAASLNTKYQEPNAITKVGVLPVVGVTVLDACATIAPRDSLG